MAHVIYITTNNKKTHLAETHIDCDLILNSIDKRLKSIAKHAS